MRVDRQKYVGERVNYHPRDGGPVETGYVTSANDAWIFVRLGTQATSQACHPGSLTLAGGTARLR